MTKKNAKAGAKAKKLGLKKETLKDLSAKNKGAAVKGGRAALCAAGLCTPPQATPCWVARVVYGEENPRWLLFRRWLLGDAPGWFRRLYVSHGERFARWLAPHAAIKSLIRRWMDWVIARG
jgi:hypothetical protein